MGADLLSELYHLFFLEAMDAKTEREARRLMKISHALAVRACAQGRR